MSKAISTYRQTISFASQEMYRVNARNGVVHSQRWYWTRLAVLETSTKIGNHQHEHEIVFVCPLVTVSYTHISQYSLWKV